MPITSQADVRYYRLRWTMPAIYFITVFYPALWLIWALASGQAHWSVTIPIAVVILAVLLWSNIRLRTVGVYEDERGIVARSSFRTIRYEWNQLAGFEHHRTGTHDYVYARLADGSRHRLTNVLQGQRVVWEGGETNEIVAVLCERLAEKRGIHSDPA